MIAQIRTLRFGLLAAMLAVLAGCSGTFSANVANKSPHPVSVQLTYTSWFGKTKVLETQRLGPGDAATLGPVKASRSWARLLAQPEGIAAPTARTNIPGGETTAHILPTTLQSGIEGVRWRLIEREQD